MSRVLEEVLLANGTYAASFGDKSKLALPPARRFAILMPASTRRSSPGCAREMLTSFATPATARATTPFGRS